MSDRARLSVVVVTFNSAAALSASLPPLVAQLDATDELIVVDNASSDGTVSRLRELAPRAQLLAQEHNLGFAAACNLGAAAATGELLVFLNPDAVVADAFAEAIRRPLVEGRGWCAWMGLVTAEQGTVVNTSGGVAHFTGIAWSGQVGEPITLAPTTPREVAFASGACLAVPREQWLELGGFSDDFFMYCEDVDLSLRVWLSGGRVGIEPAARVDHGYAFAKGSYKWRLLERNRAATVLRTYPGTLLALLAPALLATEAALLLAVAPAGGWGGAKRQALAETLRALPRLLRERRAIQARREIGAHEFARLLTADLGSPYLGRVGRSPVLRAGLRTYWLGVRVLLALSAMLCTSSPGRPSRRARTNGARSRRP